MKERIGKDKDGNELYFEMDTAPGAKGLNFTIDKKLKDGKYERVVGKELVALLAPIVGPAGKIHAKIVGQGGSIVRAEASGRVFFSWPHPVQQGYRSPTCDPAPVENEALLELPD